MTTSDLLSLVLRRWYAVLAGVALTVVVAMLVLGRGGVYESQVDVRLLPPAKAATSGVGNPNTDLVALAGLVERRVNGGRHDDRSVSAEVPLSGLGVRSGTRVLLPNLGGQWNHYFPDPVLRVQAVGPTPAAAADLLEERVVEINRVLEQLQADAAVPPRSRVGTRQVPDAPQVVYRSGSKKAAVAAVGVLGLALTLSLTVIADALLSHRRRTSARPLASAASAS